MQPYKAYRCLLLYNVYVHCTLYSIHSAICRPSDRPVRRTLRPGFEPGTLPSYRPPHIFKSEHVTSDSQITDSR